MALPERMTSAEFKRRFGGGLGLSTDPEIAKEKPAIKWPASSEPNKTEAAWMEVARRIWPDCAVLYEPITLRLPSGTRYTPDVVMMRGKEIVALCEVKGAHIHNERSVHAIKEARSAFRMWDFYFCQLVKGEWRVSPEIKSQKSF